MTLGDRLPLLGRRVLVTRPRAQAEALAARFREAGANVTLLPAIDVVPLDSPALREACMSMDRYDQLVVTSANVAEAVLRLAPVTDRVRVMAIGAATAAPLIAAGIRCEMLAAGADGEALFAALGPLGAQRILMPRSDHADPSLVEACRSAGAMVDAPIAYHTVATSEIATLPALLRAQWIDAITLASGSAARAVAGVLSGRSILSADTPLDARPRIVCIGRSTAAVATATGLPVDAVAATHDPEGMVKAVASLFDHETIAR